MPWGAAFLLSLILAACVTAPAAVNAPNSTPSAFSLRESEVGGDVIVLALSGGGARAAAFELGVLQSLRALRGADGRPLTQHVAFTTAVSGGSVLSAYWAQHGDEGLDTFRAAYLDKDWRLNSFASPATWWRTWRGGANGPTQLAAWLDREVYRGARMEELARGPRTIINAADLYYATPFAFTSLFFDALCSDLAQVRVADAVAASMAVPVVFRPVLLEAYPERCMGARPTWFEDVLADRAAPEMVRASARAFRHYAAPGDGRYVHLTDGGVADNFGLTTLTLMRIAQDAPAPFTPREAMRARRILFLVVNAERVRPGDWQSDARGPGAADVLASTLDGATNAGMRSALDAFRASLPELEAELERYRCDAEPRTRREALGDEPRNWRCNGLSVTMDVISYADLDGEAQRVLVDAPTVVSLPRESVDALIAGGRDALARNEAVRGFTAR